MNYSIEDIKWSTRIFISKFYTKQKTLYPCYKPISKTQTTDKNGFLTGRRSIDKNKKELFVSS